VTVIVNKLDICCGSAYSIIHKDHRYQNLCRVGSKAAYRGEQTGMCGNMHAVFAAIS